MYAQYQSNITPVADGNSAELRITAQRELVVSSVPSPIAPVGGGIAWGAPQTVALTGSSQPLAAANAARKGIMIINRNGNSAVSYDLSGAAVTLAGGIQMQSGFQRDWYLGAACPVGAITVIGTAAQSVTYVEGT